MTSAASMIAPGAGRTGSIRRTGEAVTDPPPLPSNIWPAAASSSRSELKIADWRLQIGN